MTQFCRCILKPNIFLKSFSIRSIVRSRDPEPSVSDGRQDSKKVPSSKKCGLSCFFSPSSWSPRISRPLTGRPVIRFPGIVMSILRYMRGWKLGLSFGLFIAFKFYDIFASLLVLGTVHAYAFIWLVKANPSESLHCLWIGLSCLVSSRKTLPLPLVTPFLLFIPSFRLALDSVSSHAPKRDLSSSA